MKPQDVIFIVVIGSFLLLRKPKWLIVAGLVCLILSIPLFGFWIFFTAERLVYYAGGFFLVAALVFLASNRE
jgi:hypothetical protein